MEPVIASPKVENLFNEYRKKIQDARLQLVANGELPAIPTLVGEGKSPDPNAFRALPGVSEVRSTPSPGGGGNSPPRGPNNRPGGGTAGAAPNPGGAGGGALVPPGGGGVGGPPAPMGLGGTIPPGSPQPPSVPALKGLMKQIDQTVLGQGLWQRTGGMTQKMALDDLGIAVFNALTSTGQIPVKLISMAPAAVADSIYRGRGSGTSLIQKVQTAFDDMKKGLEPLTNIALSVNPAARAVMNKQIADLKYAFPEFAVKLEGTSYGIQTLPQGTNLLNQANQMVTQLGYQNLPEDVQKRIQIYNQRREFNEKWRGKGFGKAEQFYEFWLKPQIWQEFFFRQPFFLGELSARAARVGFDLPRAFMGGPQALKQIPKDVLIGALDEALKFSMAYNPKQNMPLDPNNSWQRGPGKFLEASSYHGIQMIQKLGPFSMLVSGFPRMIAQGLQFSWEHSAAGLLNPMMKEHGIRNNPMAGPREWGYDDWHNITKAFVGMGLMATMCLVREKLGGPRWYEIKTGQKDKEGKPIYFDGRRLGPFATFLWAGDMTNRIATGRYPSAKDITRDLTQIGFSMSGLPQDSNAFASLGELANWMGSGDGATLDAAMKHGGRAVANYLSLPGNWFKQFRDLYASWRQEENHKSDYREHPFLGPSIDLLPWVRNQYLGPLTSPTEGTVPLGTNPGLSHIGLNLRPGQNPAGEELSRLGIDIKEYFKPDPDPIIEAAQNKEMYEMLTEQGPEIMQDPEYQKASETERRAIWRERLGGQNGLAAWAVKVGLEANPEEAERRGLLKTENKDRRKVSGLEEEIKKEYPKK